MSRISVTLYRIRLYSYSYSLLFFLRRKSTFFRERSSRSTGRQVRKLRDWTRLVNMLWKPDYVKLSHGIRWNSLGKTLMSFSIPFLRNFTIILFQPQTSLSGYWFPNGFLTHNFRDFLNQDEKYCFMQSSMYAR